MEPKPGHFSWRPLRLGHCIGRTQHPSGTWAEPRARQVRAMSGNDSRGDGSGDPPSGDPPSGDPPSGDPPSGDSQSSDSQPSDSQPSDSPVSYTHLRAHETDSYLV